MYTNNVDDIRAEREARKNPPNYEAGQGSDEDWGDLFNSIDTSNLNSPSNNDAFSGGGMANQAFSSQSMLSSYQQPTQQATTEDKIFDALVSAGKLSWKGGKELVNGFRQGAEGNNYQVWAVYGSKVTRVGAVFSGLSLLLLIISFFTKSIHNCDWFLIGGLLTTANGVGILSYNYSKLKSGDYEEQVTVQPEEPSFPQEDPIEDSTEDSIDDSWGMDDEATEPEDDIWSSWDDDETTSNEVVESYEPEQSQTSIPDIDEAINSIQEIPAHTQTRQYLYEQATRVLPNISPNFARMTPISEDDDRFIIFEDILRKACEQFGMKVLPDLLELRENLCILQLKSTRPQGLQEEKVANEIAKMYSMDEFGRVIHEGTYATFVTVGQFYIVNIFTGNNPLVSLRDIYSNIPDKILDTKNAMPMVWGINEFGEPIFSDVSNIFSYIISGIPRSGKSWKAQSMILQLCMFNSPREINFEVFDVKGLTSDFNAMNKYLPHFKNFESDRAKIVARLKYLTTVEAKRREKFLASYGVISIKDLKEKHPDVELPYLYIVIDEMLGLKEGFTKEEEADFQGMLNALVSQLPNLGFRVILIPHRIVNDIIAKTTYTLVNCRICIKAPFDEIKTALDINRKDFQYSLPNMGDMALKVSNVNSNKTVYCHGEAITSNNEGNIAVFRYIGSLWNKLEPEFAKDFNESSEKLENSQRADSMLDVNEDKPLAGLRRDAYQGHSMAQLEGRGNEEEIDLFESNDDEDIDESFWDNM